MLSSTQVTKHPIAPPSITSGGAALRSNLVAGLTAAAVVLPKAMAYATVAGLPVAVGLYTAFVPMTVYALLGSSRVCFGSCRLESLRVRLAQLPEPPPHARLGSEDWLGALGVFLLVFVSSWSHARTYAHGRRRFRDHQRRRAALQGVPGLTSSPGSSWASPTARRSPATSSTLMRAGRRW
jgi:hypothetical protein